MFEIKENFALKNFNTFGINVKTKYFVPCSSESDITEFLNIHKNMDLPLMILGGGSNVLFTGDYGGYILHPNIKGIETVNETNDEIEVRVGAGEDWDEFVEFCVEKGWGGVENLSLIPGNVGTCPIQNIGAYGVEVKDVVTKVEAIEIDTQKRVQYINEECEFGYRDSIFKRKLKGKLIITYVTFLLKKQPKFKLNYGNLNEQLKVLGEVNLNNIRQAVITIRESKLPKPEETGNAGSFFKNPIIKTGKADRLKEKWPEIPIYMVNDNLVKIPAGWLIEKAGFKNVQMGNAGVHDKQALVLINRGNATGEEIIHLARNIQQAIMILFDIELEMEVNII